MSYRLRAVIITIALGVLFVGAWLISDSWFQLTGWVAVLTFFAFWYWRLVKAQSLHPMSRGDVGEGGSETGGVGAW